MKTCMFTLCTTLFLLLQSAGIAQDQSVWEKSLGSSPPLVVATTATGPHATRFPFDPKTYGLVRGYAPSNQVSKPCIVLYARHLNDSTRTIVAKVDAFSATHPTMDAAYLHLFDEKGAQRGGYTAEELTTRIKELDTIAKSQNWKATSIGVAANKSGTRTVGIIDDNDVVIVVLKPDGQKDKPIVVWYQVINTTKMAADSLKKLEASLSTALK